MYKTVKLSSLIAFAITSLLVIFIYSTTFKAPWILDDPPNIVTNYPLHINNLMPDTLWQTFFAKPFDYGRVYRPIPCLTFALNWYIGGNNPFVFHLTNVFIHILTCLTLFATIRLLFKSPILADRYTDFQITIIALISSLLWALHPIQISAVTYIVQRMTSMATLFLVSSLFFYLKFKTEQLKRKHLLLVVLFFILALLSKENTATLPFSILLIELLFLNAKVNIFRK